MRVSLLQPVLRPPGLQPEQQLRQELHADDHQRGDGEDRAEVLRGIAYTCVCMYIYCIYCVCRRSSYNASQGCTRHTHTNGTYMRRAHGGTVHAHAHAHAHAHVTCTCYMDILHGHACLQQAHGGGAAARARTARGVYEHSAGARGVEVVERGQVIDREAAARRRLVGIGEEEPTHHTLLGVARGAQHDAPLGIQTVEDSCLVRRVRGGVGGVREGDLVRVGVRLGSG